VRRDRAFKEEGQKRTLPLDGVVAAIPGLLDEIQTALWAQARAFLQSHTIAPASGDEFYTLLAERAGMIDIPWCERPECAEAVKERTSATTRNTRRPARGDRCIACGEPATVQAYFAQAY